MFSSPQSENSIAGGILYLRLSVVFLIGDFLQPLDRLPIQGFLYSDV